MADSNLGSGDPDLLIEVASDSHDPDLLIEIGVDTGTQSDDLKSICESIGAIEDLLDSGATSVTQDGQTVVFDRKDARKRLRQLQQRKLDLEAVANGTGRRAKRRRPLLNRIDLRGY